MRATDRLAAAPPVNDEGRPVAEPARVEKDRQSLPQEEIQGQDSTADESGRVQSALDYQAQGPGRLPPRRGASCLQLHMFPHSILPAGPRPDRLGRGPGGRPDHPPPAAGRGDRGHPHGDKGRGHQGDGRDLTDRRSCRSEPVGGRPEADSAPFSTRAAWSGRPARPRPRGRRPPRGRGRRDRRCVRQRCAPCPRSSGRPAGRPGAGGSWR
jgi:hypothetical protein